MLRVFIEGGEVFDPKTETFSYTVETTLKLEHSLLSVSKWESKWHKPFIDNQKQLTQEESLDYIRCMTIGPEPPLDVYKAIPTKTMREINNYIANTMTATWFSKEEGTKSAMSREKITSELIYYWMIACQIPFECEKWHLNRLLTLIRICNVKSQSPKKMSNRALFARNNKLNKARRAKSKSKG